MTTAYPPRLTFGDSVTFEGKEQRIIAISRPANSDQIVVHLRDSRDTDTTVPLVILHADFAKTLPAVVEYVGRAMAKKKRRTKTRPDSGTVSYLGNPYDPDAEATTLLAANAFGLPTTTDRERTELSAAAPSDAGRSTVTTIDTAAALLALPSRDLKRAQRLEAHMLEALTGYRSSNPGRARPGEPKPRYDPERQTQTARLRAKAKELHCSLRTMQRYLDAMKRDGLWGLVDGRAKRVIDPLADLDPRIIQAVREQANNEADLSTGTFERFRRHVHDRLIHEYGEEAPELPNEATFRRQIDILLPGRHMFGRATTRHNTAAKPQRSYKHIKTSRPGQVVLLDSTPVDIRAYDARFDVTHQVMLTAAVDLHTRSILAWRIVPCAEKTVDAILLLLDMLRPEPMRQHWDEELSVKVYGLPQGTLVSRDARFAGGAARPVIYPETIIIDGGGIFRSADFDRACHRLGITVSHARPGQPTDKPHVESYFKRLGFDFSQHFAGHKGRNTTERGRVSEDQARWSIAQVEELFAEYIVTIYQRTPHSRLRVPGDKKMRLSPNEAYAAAIMHCGWIPAPVSDTLYYELLPTKWATIQPYGVNIGTYTYDGDILRKYQALAPPMPPPLTAKGRRHGTQAGRRRQSGVWPFHVDARNELFVYFYAPADGGWFALKWTAAPSTLEPFSYALRDDMRKVIGNQGSREATQRAVAEAMLAFQRAVDAPENWTKRNRRARSRETERVRTQLRDQAAAATLVNQEILDRGLTLRPAKPKRDSDPNRLDVASLPKLDTTRTRTPA